MKPLDAEGAYSLSWRLTTIEGCSRHEEAIKAIAEDLLELCKSEEEALALVREARHTWKKWQGTAGLIDLLTAMRRQGTPPVLPPERRTLDMGPKPAIECTVCNDMGWVLHEGGGAIWCTCAQAFSLRKESPDLLRSFSRQLARSSRPLDRPLTEVELQKRFVTDQQLTEAAIAEARAILANPDSTRERREIARVTLRTFHASEEVFDG